MTIRVPRRETSPHLHVNTQALCDVRRRRDGAMTSSYCRDLCQHLAVRLSDLQFVFTRRSQNILRIEESYSERPHHRGILDVISVPFSYIFAQIFGGFIHRQLINGTDITRYLWFSSSVAYHSPSSLRIERISNRIDNVDTKE